MAALAAVCAVATACAAPGIIRSDSLQDRMTTTQYRMVDASRSWVYVPGGLLTLQRDLGSTQEQRIALANQSTLKGDNFVLLRSRTSGGLTGGRFNLEGFVSDIGGVPYPFTQLTNRNMKTGSDAMGTYFWIDQQVGPQTVCVLAVRSLGKGAKPLPVKADAVDVLLRNCAPGRAQDALAPILAQNIGAAPGVGPGRSSVKLKNLSPFAAPTRN
ncbi:hypothetical protein ILP92_12760 [Maribius pontilimi]|uniref:Lipoprotein n=1 Tax=Palleronia pontilimi TaxID=1964209 RepID=A0A934MDL5_9RHOB|nr:hypothetical protein [Palleronia pontilimi]MBJ3763620.1 hypothetical protein [Palleronia pontilimi]